MRRAQSVAPLLHLASAILLAACGSAERPTHLTPKAPEAAPVVVTPGQGNSEAVVTPVPAPVPPSVPTTPPAPERRDVGPAEFKFAPPAFSVLGVNAVPMDIESIDLAWDFRVDVGQAVGTAVVKFRTAAAGAPFFDMVPNPTLLKLDGVDLPATELPAVADPGSITKVRVLKKEVTANEPHTLQISYVLRPEDVTFTSDAVRFGSFMSDLAAGGRKFWEQYAPSNLEFDQFAQTLDLKISGSQRPHELFANSTDVVALENNHWKIVFPKTHNTASVFVQFAETGRFAVQRFEVQGKERKVPFVIYSRSASDTAEAAANARSVFAELENTYGAYMHPSVVISLTPDGGGMEHAGATVTSLGALGHEMTHFYYARGVMPARGSAGWIDESVASWRDNGYPRGSSTPSRSPVNLANFVPFRRETPLAAYTAGARLMSEFDGMFASKGGLRTVLNQLYAQKRGAVIDTPYFQQFLETILGGSLDAIFQRYVYGARTVGVPDATELGWSGDAKSRVSLLGMNSNAFSEPGFAKGNRLQGKHPQPLPQTEWWRLR